jgi:predicted oxidoreductase
VDHVCESLFGQALSLNPSLRDEIKIITKCGSNIVSSDDYIVVCPSDINGCRVKHYDLSFDYIMTRVQESLNALKVETIDLLLIHRPSPMMDADQVLLILVMFTLRLLSLLKLCYLRKRFYTLGCPISPLLR